MTWLHCSSQAAGRSLAFDAEICSECQVSPIVPGAGHVIDRWIAVDRVAGIARVDRDPSVLGIRSPQVLERVWSIGINIEPLRPHVKT